MGSLQDTKVKSLSQKYKKETVEYTKQANAFREEDKKLKYVEKILLEGDADLEEKHMDDILKMLSEYSGKDANKKIKSLEKIWLTGLDDPRKKYADEIYKIILEYNEDDKIEELRELFPPQTEIFCDLAQEKKTSSFIRKIYTLSNEEFMIAVDTPQFSAEDNENYIYRNIYIYANGEFNMINNFLNFGTCPQRKAFAFVGLNEVILKGESEDEITNRIKMDESTKLYFPDGSLVEKNCYLPKDLNNLYIPFSDGKKMIIASEDFGVALVGGDKNILIFPHKQYRPRHKENDASAKTFSNSKKFPSLHVALSPDNKYIALGCENSDHYLYDANGNLLSTVEPSVSHAQYAIFSKDSTQVLFNSCYNYEGSTMVVQLKDLLRANKLSNKQTDKIIELDEESKVDAAVATSFGYIIGDSKGHIKAFSYQGEYLWCDYLGLNIMSMSITEDEKFLYVGTYWGVIYKIELNYGKRSPYQIGDSTNREVDRWMFWEEDKILRW